MTGLSLTYIRKELGDVLTADNAILVDATEENKSYEGVIPVIDEVIRRGFHKNNRLIAVGGGIVQDMVAFISSVLYRGVDWIHIPTTLLAQCDSCIGSKTSINFKEFKNQVGGFYPPREVHINMGFLKTLHEREIKSGFGEMLHYYVVGGEADFLFYEENVDKAFRDFAILSQLVRRSLEIKKSYIEIDEYDRNERQIFNYGHSFGHAIESITNFAVPHGIAVSYGIDMANYVSVKMGLMKPKVRNRIRKVTEKFWSQDDLKDLTAEKLLSALKKDKKNKGDMLGIILCSGFGNLAKHMVKADDAFINTLSDYFTQNGIGKVRAEDEGDEDMKYEAEYKVAKEAAIAAGEYLSQNHASMDSSIGKDIKLANDRTSEAIIIDRLQETGIPILSEESGQIGGGMSLRWIVDPLDGSMNYFKGMKDLSCVSVALWDGEIPVLGVVNRYDRQELYTGLIGNGAKLNDEWICTSEVGDVSDAVLATGFPVKRSYDEESLSEFVKLVQRFKKVRMLGTAALMGAFVAAGRMDAYMEEDIMLWDIAGAVAIVKAAGGAVNVESHSDNKCLCQCFANRRLMESYNA